MRLAVPILLVALINVPVLLVPVSGVDLECFLDYIQAYELSPALVPPLAHKFRFGNATACIKPEQPSSCSTVLRAAVVNVA